MKRHRHRLIAADNSCSAEPVSKPGVPTKKQNTVYSLLMTDLLNSFNITARDFAKAGESSLRIQTLLKSIGFDPDLIRRISICAYEAEMNAVMHGGDGELRLTVDPKKIVLEVSDNGPGIKDLELALQDGYSTATPEHREMGFGAGMGLPNIKKNADSLEINSHNGRGTHLKISFKVSDS